MARTINEKEIEQLKELMYCKGIELIKKKGIRKVTVDDITNASGMAKGTFYRFYVSKEEFLYLALKRNEKESFDEIMSIKLRTEDLRTQIKDIFTHIFMSGKSLFLYTEPLDLEYLLIKLPPEYRNSEKQKAENNFQTVTELFGFKASEENFATLSCLMDGLQTIAKSTTEFNKDGRSRAMNLIIEDIADFFVEVTNEK